MNIRAFTHALAATLLLAAAAQADAQGFTSISSLPPAAADAQQATSGQDAAAPAVPAAPTDVTTAAPPAAATLAFSSVSSLNAGSGSGPVLPGASDDGRVADWILIEKGARRLRLFSRGEVIGEYTVRLGLSPKGHKQYEGDFRTPEGVYFLSRRNPNSEYFRSVEVSYPNEADRARAKAEGLRPGGLIMIHGQPNVPKRSRDYYAKNDWTDGCIALSNGDMAEIWRRTRIGIPIEIRP
jgi:hypothetical protein